MPELLEDRRSPQKVPSVIQYTRCVLSPKGPSAVPLVLAEGTRLHSGVGGEGPPPPGRIALPGV